MSWPDTFVEALTNNDGRFVTYVPDNALTSQIKGVTSDNYLISIKATRSAARLRLR